MTKETETRTRVTNSAAVANPCVNTAGMAIKSENIGIKNQVLFRKYPKFILERIASNKHMRYRQAKAAIFLVKSAARTKNNMSMVFVRGPIY